MANADALWLPVLPSLKDFGPALIKGVAKDAEKAGKSSGISFGKALGVSAAAFAGVAAAGTLFYQVGKTFDEMSDTIAISSGATGEDLESLVESAKNVGKEVPVEFSVIGDALATLNTLTGATGESLEGMTEKVTNASRLLGEDASSNAEKFGKMMAQWNIPVEEGASKMDTLFAATQNYGVSLSGITGHLTNFGPILQNAGFTMEESAGFFSQLEAGGIAVTRVMPALNASFRKWAAEGKDSKEEFQDVVETIRDTEDAQKALALASDVFGAQGAQRLTTAIRNGTLELEDLTGALEGSEGAIESADMETRSFAENWELFKNNTLVALEPIATRVFNAVGDAMGVVTDVLNEHIIPAFDTVMGAIEGIWNIVAHGDFTEAFREAFGIEEDHPFVDFLFNVHEGIEKISGIVQGAASILFSGEFAGAGIMGMEEDHPFVDFLFNVREGMETLGEFVTDKVVPALKDFGGYIVDDIVPALKSMGEWVVDNKDWIVSLGVGVLAVVGAYQAWQLAMTIWNGVTKIATGVQAAFNAVMALNPIMLVVAAVGVLVGALVWFFTQTETGQEIWETFTNALHTAWEWVVDTISTAWTWLWEEVLEPVFNWIADAWETVSEAIDAAWEHVIKPAWEAVEDAATWLWEEVLEPIFDWIGDAWDETANVIDAAWENVIKPAWDAVENAITWLWEEVLEPIFNWIGEKWDEIWGNIDDVWSRTGKPLFDAIGKLLEGDFVGAWESAKEGIKGIWNTVMEIAAKPIDFVIDIVYNKGLRPVFNAIAGIVGINELPEFSSILDLVPQFAKGGHYGGGVALVGEEGPELINFNRPGYVHTADETSRILDMVTNGGRDDVPASMESALIGRTPQESLLPAGNWFSTAASWVGDRIMDGISWARGKLADGAKLITDPLKDVINNMLGDGPGFNQWISKTATTLIDKGIEFLRGEDESAYGADGEYLGSYDGALGRFARPARGPITSRFGPRWGGIHSGMDFAVPIGTAIRAAFDGVVQRAAWNAVVGRTGMGMLLGHGQGRQTYYGHLSRWLKRPGDEVKAGDTIAHSGNTGNSTGPHLHFEKWRNGRPINPAFLFRDQGGNLPQGLSMVLNSTGRDEAILNAQQWSDMHDIAESVRRGGGATQPQLTAQDIRDGMTGMTVVLETEAGPVMAQLVNRGLHDMRKKALY